MVIPPSFTWEHCTSSSSCYTSSTVLHCVPTTATRRGWLVRFRATHWVAMTDGAITELDEIVPSILKGFFHGFCATCACVSIHDFWWVFVLFWLWVVVWFIAHWWCPPKLKCIASPHTAHSGVQQKWSSPHAMQRVPEPMF